MTKRYSRRRHAGNRLSRLPWSSPLPLGPRRAGAASTTARNTAVSGSITFDGIWTGSEATDFGDVIKAFNQVYPKVKVNYKPLGNNETTVLATAITGGNPPDMADIAAPRGM